jgi:hypothetical protein
MDIPITRPMVQTKAKEMEQRLYIESFQAKWLESFRTWHNINF